MKGRNSGYLVWGLIVSGCVAGGLNGLPDTIVTQESGFIPEGIEYDTLNNRILTGSMRDGTIYEISASGRLTPVIEDEALLASVGIEVDEPRNRLLVANSEFGSSRGSALLGAYDLGSGARLAMVDLAAVIENPPADMANFANDVAVSRAGVAYVTDSRMNIVYQVDTYYKARVLVDFGRDSGFNINGIEYHPAGYLLVVSSGNGALIKVPVNNPRRWSLVELDFPARGGDGLVWASDGGLVSTSNNSDAVMKYRSDDNWRSARLVGMASFAGGGTTSAVIGEDIYVVQPRFGSDEPPVILRAKF